MLNLKAIWRRLNPLDAVKKPAEETQARLSIYASEHRFAFLGAVEREFGIEFGSDELKTLKNRDTLMASVREKYFKSTGKIANSHWVWGSLARLENEHLARQSGTRAK